MEQLSARVRSLAPSRTIAMNQRARSLRESGVDVIDLTVGEPDFPTPEPVRAAAKRAIDEGNNFYTPVAGYNDLREAISRKLARENGLEYPASRVMACSGAKHCGANALPARGRFGRAGSKGWKRPGWKASFPGPKSLNST